MPRPHHIRLIAKQRPFDEAQWKRLLTAFAYVLHEQRQAAGQPPVPPAPPAGPTDSTDSTDPIEPSEPSEVDP